MQIIVLLCPANGFAKRPKPLIWNLSELKEMKTKIVTDKEAQSILNAADEYCTLDPIVITKDRKLDFAPDTHFFCSMSPYRWPDPEHPGMYIPKDGLTNPDSRYYDSGKLNELAKRCKMLSQAYYLSKDKKYYNALIRQLRAWFLDEDSYMAPNFEYAQVIPGHNHNKGTSTGMIDAYFFNDIIESIRLANNTKRIKRGILRGLQQWFSDFADWSESNYGNFMREKGSQNISVAYDVTIVNMYLFAGRPDLAESIADGFVERRINKQIKVDGSQPEEMLRTNSFFYSLYNLTHMIDFCCLMRYWDKDYYDKNGERINKAFDFLQQYIDHPEAYPFQQVSGWKNLDKMLDTQLQRRNNLVGTKK